MKTILIISSDSIQGLNSLTSNNATNSVWFWISICEFIVIFLILNRYVFNRPKLQYSNLSKNDLVNSENANIDMSNVINSINQSKELYKKMASQYHPDRFIENDKKLIATEIMKEVVANKRNYSKLVELKALADIKLNL